MAGEQWGGLDGEHYKKGTRARAKHRDKAPVPRDIKAASLILASHLPCSCFPAPINLCDVFVPLCPLPVPFPRIPFHKIPEIPRRRLEYLQIDKNVCLGIDRFYLRQIGQRGRASSEKQFKLGGMRRYTGQRAKRMHFDWISRVFLSTRTSTVSVSACVASANRLTSPSK
jgi:hypothetical protein